MKTFQYYFTKIMLYDVVLLPLWTIYCSDYYSLLSEHNALCSHDYALKSQNIALCSMDYVLWSSIYSLFCYDYPCASTILHYVLIILYHFPTAMFCPRILVPGSYIYTLHAADFSHCCGHYVFCSTQIREVNLSAFADKFTSVIFVHKALH